MRLFFLLSFFALFSSSGFAVPIQGLGKPDRIPGQYILKVKGNQNWQQFASNYGAELIWGYDHTLIGLSVKASDDVIRRMADDPLVEQVWVDTAAKASATQLNPPQGIDRIDARQGRDGRYSFNLTGRDVHVFVIDTGIRSTHQEFRGRMGFGATAIRDGRGAEDCNGHGSHVAGTIGGATSGVAKEVILHAVRVLGCNGAGNNSDVIRGIDFVGSQNVRPAVANMSLGGGASAATDEAVRAAIRRGVTFVVAAGNENQNACNVSPARTGEAITVAAINDFNDNLAGFSNFGNCVDIAAPGVNIPSVGIGSDTAGAILSGTSMAAPHVAGAAALLLSQNRNLTPAQVSGQLIGRATTGRIGNPKGSPNRILFTQP